MNNESIVFIGDMMFGDQIVTFGYGVDSKHYESGYKNIFKNVSNELNKYKYVIGNFESVIRHEKHRFTNIDNFSMCCTKEICTTLKNANINVVSVANNHSMDYGMEGYKNTVKELSRSGIKIIGDAINPYIIVDIGREKIALIGVTYVNNSKDSCGCFCNPTEVQWKDLIEEVKLYADKIIVYVHWGSEFIKSPSKEQKSIAEHLKNLGVNHIIGAHPHIIQPIEYKDESLIAYSLGNFVSDYWQRRLKKSIAIEINDKNKVKIYQCIYDKNYIPKMELMSQSISENKKEVNKYSSKLDITFQRNRMRIEYLFKIISNFYRIRNKKYIIRWIKKRVKWILKNFNREIINPQIIYDEYQDNK